MTAEHVHIVREPIDTADLLVRMSHPSDGAQALFLGNVRDHHDGRTVLHLEYEAYEPMALAQLRAICEKAIEAHEVRDVGVIHRIGRIDIGEAAVAVLAVSSHRAAAFSACKWAMDEIKQRVPIFKREFYADGDRWIEGGTP